MEKWKNYRTKKWCRYQNSKWCAGKNPQKFNKRTGIHRILRTGREHPAWRMVKIGQDTEKSPGDLRSLAVTQTSVKDNHLTLVRKILKQYRNNNNGNKTRTRKKQQKNKNKGSCRIVDFAVLADRKVKIKTNKKTKNKKRGKYLEFSRELDHEGDGDNNWNWCTWNDLLGFRMEAGRVGNRRTSRDHPGYSSAKIGKTTEKISGDLNRLAVTESPIKDYRQTLGWKTCKEEYNNHLFILDVHSPKRWQEKLVRVMLHKLDFSSIAIL